MPPPPFLEPPPLVCLGFHLFLFIASSSCHQLFFPLLLRLIDALSFCQLCGSGQRQVFLTTMTAMATAMMAAMAKATATVVATASGTFPQPTPLSPFHHYLIVVCFNWALASLCSFPPPSSSPSPSHHLPTPLLPTTSPLTRHLTYHYHWLIFKYFMIFHFFHCCRVSPPVLLVGWALLCFSSPSLLPLPLPLF